MCFTPLVNHAVRCHTNTDLPASKLRRRVWAHGRHCALHLQNRRTHPLGSINQNPIGASNFPSLPLEHLAPSPQSQDASRIQKQAAPRFLITSYTAGARPSAPERPKPPFLSRRALNSMLNPLKHGRACEVKSPHASGGSLAAASSRLSR
jgi:hypothetical protein